MLAFVVRRGRLSHLVVRSLPVSVETLLVKRLYNADEGIMSSWLAHFFGAQ